MVPTLRLSRTNPNITLCPRENVLSQPGGRQQRLTRSVTGKLRPLVVTALQRAITGSSVWCSVSPLTPADRHRLGSFCIYIQLLTSCHMTWFQLWAGSISNQSTLMDDLSGLAALFCKGVETTSRKHVSMVTAGG